MGGGGGREGMTPLTLSCDDLVSIFIELTNQEGPTNPYVLLTAAGKGRETARHDGSVTYWGGARYPPYVEDHSSCKYFLFVFHCWVC